MNTLKAARNFVLIVVFNILLNVISGGVLHFIERNMENPTPTDTRCTAGKKFINALDLSSSMFSAIGYGHIIPCTGLGQFFSIVFTLIGLPLTLVTLDRIGKMFVFLTRKFWNLVTRPCKKSEKGGAETGGGKPNDQITLESRLPFSMGVGALIAWVLVTSGYFSFLQSWGYGYGMYFTVMSLTTVGLADYQMMIVPYTVINYYFLFIGLALMSMCINLAIERINEAFKQARNQLGQQYVQDHGDEPGSGPPPADSAEKVMKKQGPISFFFSRFQRGLITEDAERLDGLSEVATQTEPYRCTCTEAVMGGTKTRDVSLQVSRGLGFATSTPTPSSHEARMGKFQPKSRPDDEDHPGILTEAHTQMFETRLSSARGAVDIDLLDDGQPHWERRSASEPRKTSANRTGRRYHKGAKKG